jgi:hypothetical protein
MIGADELQRVEDTKYLGVVIDNKLRFNKNIELIQKKNNQENQLYQTFGGGKINKCSKITLYNAIIVSHFDYCSSILFLANESQLNELQKLQNRMMRIGDRKM